MTNVEKENSHTDNPYATPKAEIQISSLLSEADFYVVSFKKFLVLFLATLGLYSIYWFWKHWSLYKKATDSRLWPIPRAIFSIFFTHSLFGKIEEEAENKATESMPSLTFSATLFVITQVVYNLSDKIIPETSIALSIVLVIAYLGINTWCLWQAQKQANIACNDEEGESNDHFTGINYLFIVLGIILWALFIFGTAALIMGI